LIVVLLFRFFPNALSSKNRTELHHRYHTFLSLVHLACCCVGATNHDIILFNIYEQKFQFYHGIIFEW
jgi:hypothetical protein